MSAKKKPPTKPRTPTKPRSPAPRAKPVRREPTVEDRLTRIEARLDKIVDVLVPMVGTWKALRARIPRWIMPADDPTPDAGEE